MSTYKEIVYTILDLLKILNGDSTITEEHVIYLIGKYRVFLIELKKNKEGESSLSSENYLTIDLDLLLASSIDDATITYCNNILLKSTEKIPSVVNGTKVTVFSKNLFLTNIIYVTDEKFKYSSCNRYLKNIIYATKGEDDYLYLNSSNPLFKYLTNVKVKAIFNNSEEAAALGETEELQDCDILEASFPLEASLVPLLIELVLKELTGAIYKPKDDNNNSADDLAELVSFIRRNTKSALAQLMTE